MTPKARTALEASIKKWEKVVLGKKDERGTDDCALCKISYDADCKGCPVAKRALTSKCRGTPYGSWRGLFTTEDRYATTAEHRLAAFKMLDFLESLR